MCSLHACTYCLLLQTNLWESSEGSKSFFKFIERDQCDSLKVKRIPLIHRGTKASVDPKGNNFCILQIHPGVDTCDLPVEDKPTLVKGHLREQVNSKM